MIAEQLSDMHTITVQKERRKYSRIQAGVPIEFKPEGTEVFTHTQTSDMSVGGCYLEMSFTLPVGTMLDVDLWLGEEKVTTKARVVTHHPSFGNGIQFVDMSTEDRSKLQRFVNSANH